MRINAFIAGQLGISRRKVDRKISDGKVFVDGKPAVLGQLVDASGSRVVCDGTSVDGRLSMIQTIALYKPVAYVTTRSDPQGRKTVMDLLPSKYQTLKPAGRLDYDSEGLVLLSNDGKFIYEFTHPKFKTEKQYEVCFSSRVSLKLLEAFEKGIRLEEGIATVDRIQQTSDYSAELVIHQGWNRQVRRMASHCDNEVVKLVRTRVGQVCLDDMEPGDWNEIAYT